ncbi:MAG TPA: HDIG domain-containing protein [Isosphaeraceae bacterium]|nr:HDIG domain-containing protein [Isosphaeraceae bacterium]
MSVGKRRLRPLRAQLRPAHPAAIHQARSARKRDRLARLGVVGIAIVLTAAIVHGAGPAFSYRVGQSPTRDLRVNVPVFHHLHLSKTNMVRQAAADQIPPFVVNDPAPIRDLADRLDDLVDSVAKARTLDELPESLRATWKLAPAAFDDLRAAADTPERREELHRKLAKAFEPIIRDGALGPDTLPPNEEASRTLAVHMVDQPTSQAHTVARERITPERLARPDAPLGVEFIALFQPAQLGQTLFSLIAEKLAGTPTLTYEEKLTTQVRETIRNQLPPVYETYRKGDLLVAQGQEITSDQLALLRLEHETAVSSLHLGDKLRRGAAIIVLVAALFALIGYYIHHHEPQIAGDLGRITGLCVLVVAAIGIVRLLALQPWDAELTPVALAAMILAITYNPHFALIVTFALSLLTSLALGTGIAHFLILMGGTAAGVLTLNDVRTRTKPIKVGAMAALGYFVLTWATGIWQNQPNTLTLNDSAWRAGWGLMAGFFLGGSLPFVESAFGIVTGISLLELGDITHPLLQELVRRAPGTHNHSITVGSLAESAAEKIRANALLVRIGAYFHDIGKMLKPHYFVENQGAGAANRHANLAPAMSTLIIIGHVKDGVELARQHHLPERIIDLIEQHHGTTLVEYFYHEAARRNDGNPDGSAVLESAFRYPGPKPRSKEAGILMIADAVESASRTLSEPTPARLEGLVREIIEKRLDDGQFDECGITLRELAEIRESLIKSLIGIYHARVKYPEQKTA